MPTFEVRLRAAVLVVTAVTAWTMLIAEARRNDTGPTSVAPARLAAVATWCSARPLAD
jgi:hypothetical protein